MLYNYLSFPICTADGRIIKLGRERFEAPEALFTPSLIDSEKSGMADMVFEMIQDA